MDILICWNCEDEVRVDYTTMRGMVGHGHCEACDVDVEDVLE